MQGISITHNIEKHRQNLVRVDTEKVANRITTDKQNGLMAIEEDYNDIDTNNEDEDKDSDTDDE